MKRQASGSFPGVLSMIFVGILFSVTSSHSQGYCPMGVSIEPRIQQITVKPGKISQTNYSYLAKWANLPNSSGSDDARTSVVLPAFKHSSHLLFSDFAANIPAGAKIHGIEVWLEGQSSRFTSLAELSVTLLAAQSGIVSINKANTAFLQKPWQTGPDSRDTKWCYGSKQDTWGIPWSADILNAADFSLEVQIRNATNAEISASLDDIRVIIHYTPLYVLCSDSCAVFYVDPFRRGSRYQWHLPENFMAASREDQPAINIKAGQAPFGTYTLCADIFDQAGTLLETCCRQFNYEDCASNAIKGLAFEDVNNNRRRDVNEPLLPNIGLSLKNPAGQTIRTATTNTGGVYLFDQLPSGNYYVAAQSLPGLLFVPKTTGIPDNVNSDISAAFGQGTTSMIALSNGVTIDFIDVGFVKDVELGDRVWHDLNNNGWQDTGEPGLANILVELKDGAQNIVQTKTTGQDGMYRFLQVYPGTYSLSFKAGTQYNVTCQQGNAQQNSNIDPDGNTALYSLVPGSKTDTIDAGFVSIGSLEGVVFEDQKADGRFDAADILIPGAEVILSGTTGCGETVLDTTWADMNGSYHFGGLKPGTYTLFFNVSDVYLATVISGNDSLYNKMNVNRRIDSIQLLSGEDETFLHAGFIRRGAISGFVWNDENTNSYYDDTESGLQGAPILLEGTDAFGTVVNATVTTNAAGRFIFNNLLPGQYRVFTQINPGFGYSPRSVQVDTTRDNDSENGLITGLALCSGQAWSHVGTAVFAYASVGDKVWEDTNGNGIFEPGEPGISGIMVSLNGTDVFGNNVAEITETNANGLYRFQALTPGTYSVSLAQAADYMASPLQQGNDNTADSDIDNQLVTAPFQLVAGQNNLSIDAGLYRPSTIRGFVWEDLQCDGNFGFIDRRIVAIAVRLQGQSSIGGNIDTMVLTASDGTYTFPGLAPGEYQVSVELTLGFQSLASVRSGIVMLSGQTLSDVDFALFRYGSVGDYVWWDSNENGLQDTLETGLDSVIVSLEGYAGGQFVSQQTITANGYYIFENIKPGEYTILVQSPEDFQPTTRFSGNPDSDSDIDENGRTDMFFILSGTQNYEMDAGFTEVARGSIGDFVWHDENGNGIQDAAEPGIQGVEVILAGTDNTGNNVNFSVFTNEQGFYSFTNLREGTYSITFGLAAGFRITTANKGNGSNDSKPESSTGVVPAFFLSAGFVNNDIDAGYYREATVGDRVWSDVNENGLQDIDERGLQGIKLTLYEENNPLPLAEATSDTLGNYHFDGLQPGSYYIVADIPSGKNITLYQAGGDEINSDFYEENQSVRSSLFSLTSGQISDDIDLGLFDKSTEISGIVWRDSNADGILENGETRFAAFDVLLINAAGDTIAVTETDSTGFYLFTGLPAGLYRVVFSLSDSLTFTKVNQGNDPETDSDVLDLVGGIVLVNVNAGDKKTGLNAGYVLKSSIGDYVWLDENQNGLQDVQETGINGITVYLYNLSQVLLDSTLSSVRPGNTGSGYYTFKNILPGDYYVRFALPDNLLFTQVDNLFPALNSDVTGTFGVGTTDTLVVGYQEEKKDVDAGLLVDQNALGQINGVVWEDVNANGTRETADLLLDGVEVTLYDLDGTLVDIVFTDTEGKYRFDDVFFGSYYISVADVINRVFVLYNGQNTEVDSDITNEFGQGSTRIISMFPGDTLYNIDLGYAPKISLGDFVWEDLNYNGLQDPGEPGVSGVEIELLDSFGILVRTTVSDASGMYVFDDLAAGRYGLRMVTNGDYLLTTPGVGSPSLNSKADLNGLIAISEYPVTGQYNNLDFGLIRPAQIGSRLWLDLNGNGIFNQNEPGIQDVNVELYTDAGILVKTTKTGPTGGGEFVGSYRFTGVRPGNYYLRFVIPSAYQISESLIGSPDTDSDITGQFGRGTTNVFSIVSGESKYNIDGAAYLPACIGDRVWNDLNKDGNQDAGEPGIGDILVSLYTSTGMLLDTMRTDTAGTYKFNNLRSRLYYLRFSMKEGFQFTLSFNGSSSSTDSDVDETGTTPLISLAHGSVFLDVDAGMYASQNRMIAGIIWDDTDKDGMKGPNEAVLSNIKVRLLDKDKNVVRESVTNHAGHYMHAWDQSGVCFIKVEEKVQYKISKRAVHAQQLCNDINQNGMSDTIRFEGGLRLKKTNGAMFYSPTTSLSGFVWKDVDNDLLLDFSRDSFIENAVVLLFSKQNVFIKSTQTDQNGYYILSGLDPGQYYVKIPQYTGLDFLLHHESGDSYITLERGAGTSSVFLLDIQNPRINFNLGYKTLPSLQGQPESEGEEARMSFVVYPNPTIYNIKVDLKNAGEEASFQLSDNQGRQVRAGIIQNGTVEINMVDLPQGMYILELDIDGQKVRKKIFRMENY